jgi:hypothetical protein
MILPIHIIIATASLVFTGILYFYPSVNKLYTSYVLVALTLITGFYLTLSKPAHLTQTCITGLAYLAIVALGIVHARNKLATVTNRD